MNPDRLSRAQCCSQHSGAGEVLAVCLWTRVICAVVVLLDPIGTQFLVSLGVSILFIVFRKGGTSQYTHRQCRRVPFSPHPCGFLRFSLLLCVPALFCGMISHCSLGLHLPDDRWRAGILFHVPCGRLHFFEEVSAHLLSPCRVGPGCLSGHVPPVSSMALTLTL